MRLETSFATAAGQAESVSRAYLIGVGRVQQYKAKVLRPESLPTAARFRS